MLVKTLWVDLEGNINCLKSKVEFVVDFVCVNLVKVDEGFWKDKFGKIRDVESYTAAQLIENISKIKQEN